MCVLKFNITINYMLVFENNYTHIITVFVYSMVDTVLKKYSKISYSLNTTDLVSFLYVICMIWLYLSFLNNYI